jgi:hypothetical protein
MKITAILLITLSFVNPSELDKSYVPYGVIISKSDLIVDGTVSKLSEFDYEFLINDYLKGADMKTIKVEHWKQWMCDERLEKLNIDQRLILFLKKKKGNSNYEIIHGSSGELFIRTDNSVETFSNKKFPKIDELKTGIRMFIKAYQYFGKLYETDSKKRVFKLLIEQSEIEKMKNENLFFKALNRPISSYVQ